MEVVIRSTPDAKPATAEPAKKPGWFKRTIGNPKVWKTVAAAGAGAIGPALSGNYVGAISGALATVGALHTVKPGDESK